MTCCVDLKICCKAHSQPLKQGSLTVHSMSEFSGNVCLQLGLMLMQPELKTGQSRQGEYYFI